MAKRRKRKSYTRYSLLILIVILGISVIAAMFVYRNLSTYNVVKNANDTSYKTITVQSGMSGKSIAQMLQDEGIIDNATKFRKRAQMMGYDQLFQAGEYQLSASMSTEEIYYALQNAKRATTTFTIPEGYTIKMVGEKLAADGLVASAEEFYAACEDDYNYWFIPEANYADPTGTVSAQANRLEGYLFPNTYEVFEGASAHDIVDKMLNQFNTVFTEDYKAQAAKKGYSVQEIVTIASLIERETRVDAERELVASVIYNRLNKGMKLQIDATIQYALGETKDRVLYSDLEIDSPYNTYKVKGLPAGPIASPGKASIDGALFPAETSYIYYVLKSKDSVEHNFATTDNEFINYKNQYLKTM